MFQYRSVVKTPLQSFFVTLEVIFFETVAKVRGNDGNAIMALVKSLLQNVILIASFYVMIDVLGLRNAAIRGNYMLYVMSGIFVFMTHMKGLGAVFGAASSTSPMLLHRPLNTFVSIVSGALSALYLQVLATFLILAVTHVLIAPITVYEPVPSFGCLLLAWASGCAVGLVLFAVKPWFPVATTIFQSVYMRVNMIASGKMFVANYLPPNMIKIFDWNILFHIIDQGRGHIFINYFPHKSNIWYSINVSIILIAIGLMGEFFTRKLASASWNARR